MKNTDMFFLLFMLIVNASGCMNLTSGSTDLEPKQFNSYFIFFSPQNDVKDTLIVHVAVMSEEAISTVAVYIDGEIPTNGILSAQPYRFVQLINHWPDSSKHTVGAKAYTLSNVLVCSEDRVVIVNRRGP